MQNNSDVAVDEKTTSDTKNPEFNILHIYTRDLSFESPNSPQMLREQWEPKVDIDLNADTKKLDEHLYEIKLIITVTVKNNDKTAFLVEVQQAGIFAIQGFKNSQLARMLGSFCPNILFPYARAVISDLVVRGGFPPLYLAPINFDALYDQHLQKQQSTTPTQSSQVESKAEDNLT